MNQKMIGARYPYCSSSQKYYKKRQMQNGEFFIEHDSLIFRAKNLFFLRVKSMDLYLPLSEIEKVETTNLNGVMPFGVCVFMKDGTEYMLGHMRNHKLKKFIMDAMEGKEVDPIIQKKRTRRKIVWTIVITLLLLSIIGIGIKVYSDLKQEDIVKEEINKIHDIDIYSEEIDMNVKSSGSYAKVEKDIKEFYQKLFEYKHNYLEHAAITMFNEFTVEYLANNRNNIREKLALTIEYEKISETAIHDIIAMLHNDSIVNRMKKLNLDSYYNDFYKELMALDENEGVIEEWKKELNKNRQNFVYLKELIQILVDYDADWYVEGGEFYIRDDYALNRYNELYNKIYQEEE